MAEQQPILCRMRYALNTTQRSGSFHVSYDHKIFVWNKPSISELQFLMHPYLWYARPKRFLCGNSCDIK